MADFGAQALDVIWHGYSYWVPCFPLYLFPLFLYLRYSKSLY